MTERDVHTDPQLDAVSKLSAAMASTESGRTLASSYSAAAIGQLTVPVNQLYPIDIRPALGLTYAGGGQ